MIAALDQVLDYAFNQRALMAALMIGFTNGFLGGYVVLRKSSLFAGALSHTLFPGIALGALIAGLNPFSALIGATVMALVVGLSSQAVARYCRVDPNAAMAILFTAAFSAGLLILGMLDEYLRLEDYLFGNILGLSDLDLWFAYGVGALCVGLLLLFQRPLLIFLLSPRIAATQGISVRGLDTLLAALLVLTMVISIQAVGTILALGLLVAPAAILYLFVESPRKLLWGGGFLGAGVAASGIFLADWFNVQTGPMIVLTLGALFLTAFVLSPRHGLIRHLLAARQTRHG